MTITVIGLGPMGNAIALALKTKGVATHIVGAEKDPELCKKALAPGIADEIKILEESLNSEIIILATPVTETANLLPNILNRIGDNTVVMDMGPAKQEICKTIKKHPRRKQFVATHPVIGTTNNIVFDNKTVILCADDSALWVVERVSELYEALNMKLLFMKAEDHDLHMTYLSHLPYIASFTMASVIQEKEMNKSIMAGLSDAGFAPMLQLAQSSADTWEPVFKQNSKNISKALDVYIKYLTKFKRNIDKKNKKLKK